MLGTTARLKSLEVRKGLLIAESELNRARLAHDWRALENEARALINHNQAWKLLIFAGFSLLSGPAPRRPEPAGPAAEKPAWWQNILAGARTFHSLWLTLRGTKEHPKPATAREGTR